MAMLLIPRYLCATFHLLMSLSITAKILPPYTPTDYFLLNCSLSSNSTSPDGRHYEGDSNSKFSPPNIHTTSSTSEASQQDPYVTEVPYMTACIFQSPTSHIPSQSRPAQSSFACTSTQSYSNLDKTRSFFSVSANDFTLLTNFSVFLTVLVSFSKHPSAPIVVKEFIITVLNSHHLNVTFIPSSSSYAFVNGIEIVSMPNNLYLRDQDSIELVPNFVNFKQVVCSVNTTALETMYRLNVGGQEILNIKDTGMFRTWKHNEDYIYENCIGTLPHLPNITIKYSKDTPVYTAPKLVYSTSRTMAVHPEINLSYNLTWIFPVDTGFIYLVRLHFCETQLEVTKVNQRVFRVFIYNQTAEEATDVIQWSGETGIPMYKDYFVLVPKKIQGKQDLWLALHPNRDLNPEPEFADAVLNSVEIFKLNQSKGNLAGPNPELVVGPTSGFPEEETENKNPSKFSLVMFVAGTVGGASFAIMICSLCFLAYWLSRNIRRVRLIC
ncbi:hypothetical protein CJ030_MR5G009757 [Morella rubra]|uniref:Malectin-like domain-containing protein n=1 Tax=Morella rubra TaxID=262757 RepID=A0A6A1VJC7_9ROSI|nr:hypothetical protein CJ030_MR5G009757 [Morella rubra]